MAVVSSNISGLGGGKKGSDDHSYRPSIKINGVRCLIDNLNCHEFEAATLAGAANVIVWGVRPTVNVRVTGRAAA